MRRTYSMRRANRMRRSNTLRILWSSVAIPIAITIQPLTTRKVTCRSFCGSNPRSRTNKALANGWMINVRQASAPNSSSHLCSVTCLEDRVISAWCNVDPPERKSRARRSRHAIKKGYRILLAVSWKFRLDFGSNWMWEIENLDGEKEDKSNPSEHDGQQWRTEAVERLA